MQTNATIKPATTVVYKDYFVWLSYFSQKDTTRIRVTVPDTGNPERDRDLARAVAMNQNPNARVEGPSSVMAVVNCNPGRTEGL